MSVREIVTPTAVPVPVTRSLVRGAPEDSHGHDRSPGAFSVNGASIPKPPARRIRLQESLARIRGGKPVQKVLDAVKRRLRLDGVELGGRLSESSWALLDTLIEFRQRGSYSASDNDGILATEHKIAYSISACNVRCERQRQLPPGVSDKGFVRTHNGCGYRLHPSVLIRARGEAGLVSHEPQDLALLYQQEGGI